MPKRILIAAVIALVSGLIVGSIAFYVDTASQREQAAQIQMRAAAWLARLAEKGSLSPSETAMLDSIGRADSDALARLGLERSISSGKATGAALFTFLAAIILGIGYAVIVATRRRAT